MRTEDAVSFFGTKKRIADLLGILPTAVSQWGDTIPMISAMRLEELSYGNLKVDRSRYDERGKPRKDAA
jgi:hypothetical protein